MLLTCLASHRWQPWHGRSCGSSQLLSVLHYFKWDGAGTAWFSSSQYLQHQHDAHINIFIPAGVWQMVCSCLCLELRKSRISFLDQAETDSPVQRKKSDLYDCKGEITEKGAPWKEREAGVCAGFRSSPWFLHRGVQTAVRTSSMAEGRDAAEWAWGVTSACEIVLSAGTRLMSVYNASNSAY